LDIEYIKAVAPDVPLTVVYNSKYSLLDWCTQITNLDNSPLVHSVSYGNDERQQSSDAYMFSANTAFMKAGAQGLSILFASGDQGVCGREGCGGLFSATRFKPDFPAASPYITAVGGTDFVTYQVGDEQAWQSGGGGFSDTFDIPAYQADAVAAYKARSDANLPDQAYWNNTGRGYPDVSALGGTKTSYCVQAGSFEGVAGTSASSPVVAGIFARLNGLRLAAGKPAMGFLNPFIYQNPTAFWDVKVGVNKDTSKNGFTATEGWDAATGFGTPNYELLAPAAMAAVESHVIV
jgi:tripeptidyl-peptidase-1